MLSKDDIKHMTDEEFRVKARAELKKMNVPRAERRRKEKEFDKNYKLMKAFSPKQLKLIESVVEYSTRERLAQKYDEIEYIADMATSAYLYLMDEDMSREDVFREQEIMTNLFVESYQKYRELIEDCKGDVELGKKKFEKYEDEVEKACRELINSGKKQGEAVSDLVAKFPMLSKAMLINAYKKVKDDMKSQKAAEYVFDEDSRPEDLEEIFKENGGVEINVDEEKEETPQSVIEPQKNETDANTPRKDFEASTAVSEGQKRVSNETDKPKLKIKSRKLIVEGEFGEYLKDENGVTINNKTYADKDMVEKEAESLIQTQEENIQRMEADIRALHEKMNEANNIIMKVQNMSAEIKEVMEM